MILALLLAQAPFNLNGQAITKVNCDGGITCTKTGTTVSIVGTGSGGSGGPSAPVDGGYVVWSASATSGSTNERVLTAGTNVTISTATPGQVIINASGGGSGSVNTASGSVSFDGGSYDALTTVTAAWASGSSVITCVPTGEEASVEGLQLVVISKGTGSFVVRAEPRSGTHWGALPFECVGN